MLQAYNPYVFQTLILMLNKAEPKIKQGDFWSKKDALSNDTKKKKIYEYTVEIFDPKKWQKFA